MPDKSNVPEGIIKEREIDRRFSDLFKPRNPQVTMLTWAAYEDLCSRCHECLLHQELPVVVVETYADDEWAYRTPPARLEVSCAIMEEIRAWEGPINQHKLEKLLGSTRRKTCPALTQGERDSTRHADQLKGITD